MNRKRKIPSRWRWGCSSFCITWMNIVRFFVRLAKIANRVILYCNTFDELDCKISPLIVTLSITDWSTSGYDKPKWHKAWMTMTDVMKDKKKSLAQLPLMPMHEDVHYCPQYWRYSIVQEQYPWSLIFRLVYPKPEEDSRWFYMLHDSKQYHPERKNSVSFSPHQTNLSYSIF